MSSRLVLGTVQFGLPYGVASRGDGIKDDEVGAILSVARKTGIDTLDTAILYGKCEQLLGTIGINQWQVITKLPDIPETCKNVTSLVRNSVEGSIKRLRVSKLYGLLLHNPQQLHGSHGEALYQALVATQDEGKVEKIGVSVYGPDELDVIWPIYQFDLVQAPFNIFDRRLVSSGWLSRLHDAGTEVHVRSIFLQGLLLMNATNRPEKFNRWQSLWNEWHRWLTYHALTPLQACLGFAISQPAINRVVIGVDSLEQLLEIFASTKSSTVVPPESLMSTDLDLINPSRWSSF
jgi:aryl-alcohol dehydrogenase-like predicted oxidoreductase